MPHEKSAAKMVKVRLVGHCFFYPISDILQTFYGSATYDESRNICMAGEDDFVLFSSVTDCTVTTKVQERPEICYSKTVPEGYLKREVKRQLYFVLSKLSESTYPWGSLTGIRPTLPAREVKAAAELSDLYGVREDKSSLALEVLKNEDAVMAQIPRDQYLIYIGIPFCRTRCSYCSFISREAPENTKFLPEFKEALLKEMEMFFTEYSGLQAGALYIGGGTPTVFSERDLADFLKRAFRICDAKRIPEITVEAGRPDTITKEKLKIMLSFGVTRICINPQTLQDETLKRIGRDHTAREFIDAFVWAREAGFSVINTDVIAGLPGEDSADFIDTMERILLLAPENITVHTLSKKRASTLNLENKFPVSEEQENKKANEMISHAHKKLHEKDYIPYYLYRQKYTLGGLENTGYTKEGFACLYNTAMMSDLHSVAAFGSGISKRVFSGGRLERCPGLKNPDEYISRISEITQRKVNFFR